MKIFGTNAFFAMISPALTALLIQSALSRKRPPLLHDKVVAYGKNQNKPKLEWLTC